MKLSYRILSHYLGNIVEYNDEKYILVGVRKSYDSESSAFMVYLSPVDDLEELVKLKFSKPTTKIKLHLKRFEKMSKVEEEMFSKIQTETGLISSKVSTEVWSTYRCAFLCSLGYDMHSLLATEEDE